MLNAVCPACQARYRVPEDAAGRRTACKKCGATFQILRAAPGVTSPTSVALPGTAGASRPAAPTSRTADERPPRPADRTADDPFGGLDLEALAGGAAVEAPSRRGAGGEPASSGSSSAGYVRAVEAVACEPEPEYAGSAAYTAFGRDVGRSFLFLARPSSFLTFLVLWFLLDVRTLMSAAVGLVPYYVGGAMLTGMLAITGWYWAFRLNVVISGAAGDDKLPSLSMSEGWWDDILKPFFQLLATYIFALAPATIFLIVLCMRMGVAAGMGGGPAGAVLVPSDTATATFVALVGVGLFIWPMMVLVVACGGSVWAMFELDLILATIAATLPAYVLTVVAVYVSFAANILITMLIWARSGADQDALSWVTLVGLPSALVSLEVYFDVIAMRAIGSYYRFFKDRFAWSWG